ncbi:hypothetical protein MATL_G00170430 [Megalops atlanticus]|uniref:Uncharacterized protein n=1 Tax=Megalops atlanticus TaxID=7932 RepID=A0A9D3PR21_MEGAT|nr:hypothetical protein MATL_G00170430 [Megalops atlanticus]
MSLDVDSNGDQKPSLIYEDDSFETWQSSDDNSSTVTERPATASCAIKSQWTESYSSDSFLSYQDEAFEQHDENECTVEEELRRKWIGILRTEPPPSKPPLKQRSNPHLCRGSGRLRPEERVALKEFCRGKIRQVQSWQETDPPACRPQQSQQTASYPEQSGALACCPVPRHFISMLRLKSFTEEMKQAVMTELHQPSRCTLCQDKLAELAQDAFIRKKRTQLQSWLLQDKLNSHLCNKDSICLVGEALRDIPKTSDDPSKIWQALLAKGPWTAQ